MDASVSRLEAAPTCKSCSQIRVALETDTRQQLSASSSLSLSLHTVSVSLHTVSLYLSTHLGPFRVPVPAGPVNFCARTRNLQTMSAHHSLPLATIHAGPRIVASGALLARSIAIQTTFAQNAPPNSQTKTASWPATHKGPLLLVSPFQSASASR